MYFTVGIDMKIRYKYEHDAQSIYIRGPLTNTIDLMVIGLENYLFEHKIKNILLKMKVFAFKRKLQFVIFVHDWKQIDCTKAKSV